VRFRLAATNTAPTGYPPTSGYDLIGSTPNTSSTSWTTYTFPDWTAPNDENYLTVNPENDESVNDGNFVSWGLIDDICIQDVPCLVNNGGFTDGRVIGSMPAASVNNWVVLTQTPQVVDEGCDDPGAIQMWGNQVVGESVQQLLPGLGIRAGKTYRVSVCYRWLNNNPNLPQYVRFRVAASNSPPAAYPPVAAYDVIGVTPNTSSTSWTTYTFPDWTAPNNASFLTLNPENDSFQNDGNFVSWGLIDDICIQEVPCAVVTNGDFTVGRVTGSMPAASVANWSLLTQSPQVVDEGCHEPGAIQMWGNLVVGESVQQLMSPGFKAGYTYRITVCYRWLDNNPNLPQYVRFRLAATSSAPSGYPPTSGYDLIGSTPNTSSTSWISYTFPDWTAPNNDSYLTINPENNESVNDGNFVSWGLIDDVCIEVLPRAAGVDDPVSGVQSLRQNSPNPFGTRTSIRFALARPDRVNLRVYDVAGRVVRRLLENAALGAGEQNAQWDGRDEAGARVKGGVYFYRLEVGGISEARRMILVR
jgi:hypothetical protein